MGGSSKLYLFVYNLSMTLGWAFVMARLVKSHLTGASESTPAYEAFKFPLQVFQTGAVLEVFHSLVGLVRAPWTTTFIQVLSRVFVVWAALYAIPEVQSHLAVSSMVLAWSLTEVPRYLYFAVSSQGAPPRWLLWLRYSTFLILYPVGAGSEMAVLYASWKEMAPARLYSFLVGPARISVDFYRLTLLSLLSYIPGLPTMYHHMLIQRSKNLAKAAGQTRQKTA